MLLSVAAIALLSTLAGRDDMPGQAAVETTDDIASGAASVAGAPARSTGSFFSRIGGMWTATDRVAQLEAENRDLRAWRSLAERLAERNARYEALLRMPADAFGAGADVSQAISAQVVLDSGGPFTRTLVSNAGAAHGVRIGYVVLNEAGLVGRVVSVGRSSSRVLMLDDFNSRIPVMGEASRVRAVLVGRATAPPDLLTRPFSVESPRLDFVVGARALREGERIITSGDGGLFPRGIPVGAARRSRDESWRVALASSQQPLDFVRIIPYVRPQTPESAPAAEGQGAEPLPAPNAVASTAPVAATPTATAASTAPVVIPVPPAARRQREATPAPTFNFPTAPPPRPDPPSPSDNVPVSEPAAPAPAPAQ